MGSATSSIVLTAIERFRAKFTVVPSGCWEWHGAKLNARGYGRFLYEGKNRLAHRVSYALHKGDPEGWMVLHRCNNPKCVNPGHLYLGDQFDNMRDRKAAGWKAATGEENGHAKLTEHSVRNIRAMYALGVANGVELSLLFGVSNFAIYQILNRKVWKHI